MTIWLLVLVLLASLAGLGYRQGAIRVAFSLVGILVGVLLAAPLGRFLRPVLGIFGLKNPVEAWLIAPLVVFVIISILFKVAAAAVHHKVDVYFKYHAGDLRMALWERLNRRLGLCLGLVNGSLYAILIGMVVFVLSYWTIQVATPDSDPKTLRLLNRLGTDLYGTGFAKVARAIDPMRPIYYDTADLAGVLYYNSLLEARLARYPAFLGLAERPEFQEMGNDKEFTEAWQRKDSVMTLVDNQRVQAVLANPDLLKLIWNTLTPDLSDLRNFLETGLSSKYDPISILGRWKFDVNAAFGALRRAKPNLPSTEMQKWKKWMLSVFTKTTFVAMTDNQALLKEAPPLRAATAGAAPSSGPATFTGTWKAAGDGKYQLTLAGPGGEDLPVVIEHDRLSMKIPGMDWVFDRED